MIVAVKCCCVESQFARFRLSVRKMCRSRRADEYEVVECDEWRRQVQPAR
jgi:hypothetical protein